jgi:hypothetical protein
MLENSIAVLSSTPPPSPIAARREALGNANAAISRLEVQLGIAHSMPWLNPARAEKRLAQLQQQLVAKAPTAPVSAAALAPVARPIELTGSAVLDNGIADSGCHSRRHYSAKVKRDKLFAAAASLPAGSLTRQCAERNLAAAQAALERSN